MLRFAIIVLMAFVTMEFFSYLVHRFVYHKLLWIFHKSHHTPRKGAFEWNDIFPLVFASTSISVMSYAVADPGRSDLLALAIGIALYGMVYFVIHDMYVHRRVKNLTFRVPYLQRVKKAHMVHHTYGAEPYGLLLFPLPKELRNKPVIEDGAQ
jgi:beta-carotene 3-hydroxylase